MRQVWCSARALPGNPAVDVLLEHLERHTAGAEHAVVEFGQAEASAERLPGALAQLDDLQLANHVAARLSWLRDVAIDFALRTQARQRAQVVDRLRTGPVLRMQSRIDHQAPRAEQRHLQLPEQTCRVAVVPALLGRQS